MTAINLTKMKGLGAIWGITLLAICLVPPAVSNSLAGSLPGKRVLRAGGANSPGKLKCPRDPKILQRKLMDAYKKLLTVMGTGEGGKMDTPQKRRAYEIYKFYEKCYIHGDGSPGAKRRAPLPLLSCRAHWESRDTLMVAMTVREATPYESLARVEISIRDNKGKEFFRAMNNRSSQCAPIPPNAFGVFPLGAKKNLTLGDVISAGQGANIPVETRYGSLAPGGCGSSTKKGVLTLTWRIRVLNGAFPDHRSRLFVKIVPKGGKDAPWIPCSPPALDAQSLEKSGRNMAAVTPLLCFKNGECRAPGKITLVRLSRQTRKGVIKRWTGDTAFAYSYQERSRKVVDITNLPAHKIALEPGFYRFEYNDVRGNPPVGFYGRSKVFEVKGKENMEVRVNVKSAL